jgi:hypothetical protein
MDVVDFSEAGYLHRRLGSTPYDNMKPKLG